MTVLDAVPVQMCAQARRAIYRAFMVDFGGWLTCYFAPWIYPAIFFMLLLAYGAVAILQFQKIRKIPMDLSLKNVE